MTQKQIQTLALALRPETVLLAFEGEIRSGKTVDMIQIFHEAVYYNPGELHAICGRDYNAIRDNLLKCNGFGLLDRFSDVDYGKEKIGGYFLTMKGYDGHTKQILLAGYDKVNQWEAILGKTINVITPQLDISKAPYECDNVFFFPLSGSDVRQGRKRHASRTCKDRLFYHNGRIPGCQAPRPVPQPARVWSRISIF